MRADQHLGLAGFVLKRMGVRLSEFDDCRSAVLVALVRAAQLWKDDRSAKFSSYAVPCMIGAVKSWRQVERRFRRREWVKDGVHHMRTLALFSELGDRYVGGNANLFAVEPEVESLTPEQRERVNGALQLLSYREREVIKLRFGIGQGYAYTLDEVARIFRVTRERIRQIEQRAILKLREKAPTLGGRDDE